MIDLILYRLIIADIEDVKKDPDKYLRLQFGEQLDDILNKEIQRRNEEANDR